MTEMFQNSSAAATERFKCRILWTSRIWNIIRFADKLW